MSPAFRAPRTGASPRPRSPLFAVLGALLVVAVLAGFAVQIMTGGDGNKATGKTDAATAAAQQKAADRQALVAYTDALDPLGKEGGKVVQMGLKAGVADIHDRRYPDAQLESMATAWKGDLERISGEFAALDAPPFLADAKFLYEAALQGYVGVAGTLLAAVSSDGQVRDDLVSLAAGQGKEADKLYDRASDIVDRHRERLGIPVEKLPSEIQDEAEAAERAERAKNDAADAGTRGVGGER